MTRVVLRTLAAIMLAGGILAQRPRTTERPNVPLPAEAAGVDQIVRALVSAFDHVDVVALGEVHARKEDSDLRIALVRDADFAKKVRSIVVEFGSTTEQVTLDRYVRGENVTRAELERVWKTTTQAPRGVERSDVQRLLRSGARRQREIACRWSHSRPRR